MNLFMQRSLAGAVATIGMMCAAAGAAVIPDSAGYPGPQPVYHDYGRAGIGLAQVLAGYTDPGTGAPMPITRPDGSPLIVGDVLIGEDPAASHQLPWQRFLVTGGDARLTLTYLGLGAAGYKSLFGVYSYAADQDPLTATLSYTQLFVQNVTPADTQVTFTVPVGHYFGFYLDADGYRASRGMYYTESFRNSDNHLLGGGHTDHFLMFQTNRGLLLAVEDLAYNPATGRLGDQDYEDLLVGFISFADGTPIPEPATVALLAAGGLCMLPGRRSRGIKR